MEKFFFQKHKIYSENYVEKSINRFYRIALNRFISELKHQEIKKLLSFGYLHQTPDYSDEFYQLYYYLKYFYAYSFLYHKIYLEAINEICTDKLFHVVSLGCGGLIDFFGIHFALSKLESKFDFTYIGIDKIRWKTINIEKTPKLIVRDIFEMESLNKYLTDGINIIIFPHSFFEISCDKLSDILHKTKYKCKELIFIFTPRKASLSGDKLTIEKVFSDLKTNLSPDYTSKNSIEHFKIGDGRITENDEAFRIHVGFIDAMNQNSLFKKCKNFIQHSSQHCSDSCTPDSIRSNIMVSSSYLHFSMGAFQKNDH